MKFIETLKNVWKITELKDRIMLTLGLLLVYRFGAQVVLPGIDASQLGSLASETDSGLLGLCSKEPPSNLAASGPSHAMMTDLFAVTVSPLSSVSVLDMSASRSLNVVTLAFTRTLSAVR